MGIGERGNKFLRCVAQTPNVHLRGQGTAPNYHLFLYPRRRLLGASPHSVGFQSHAFLIPALSQSHALLSPIILSLNETTTQNG